MPSPSNPTPPGSTTGSTPGSTTGSTTEPQDLELVAARERSRSALFGSEPPTTRVDRFTILEPLGSGGMGVVFAAYDPQLDRRVALKVLRRDAMGGQSDGADRRLLREAQAMARVSHPNVIAVFEAGSFEGQVFIAMEHVAGQTLRAWLKTGPDPAAILEVFEQAGRGLAAAHEAGLVHRDFKPENVMIGDDGRVRVLDFGLARGGMLAAALVTGVEPRERVGEVGVDTSLTRTGAVLGTPAYMAPEQLDGERVDASSDQFAFCVALYEALYGQLPFGGTTAVSRVLEIEQGRRREPPTDRRVGRAIQLALERGLSARPEERFADMSALLSALRPAPRRRWILGAAVAGVVALVGVNVVLGERHAPPSPCADAGAPMQSQWTPARAERLAATFERVGASFGPSVWLAVSSRLDDYASRWATARVEACEATRVQGTQSEGLLDRRMACLERGRRRMQALLQVWDEADSESVARATAAVAELPEITRCAELDRLVDGVRPPGDPALRRRVDEARERLAAIRAQESAGDYWEGLSAAERFAYEAASIPYPPLHADAAMALGRLRLRTGQHERAVATLSRAYEIALAERYDEVAVPAAEKLGLILGQWLSRLDEGFRWSRHAIALLERNGFAGELSRRLLRLQGILHLQGGERRRAREFYARALEWVERDGDPDGHEAAMAHYNLGMTVAGLGQVEDARAHHERARELFVALGGAAHPDVAFPLHGLADLDYRDGRYERAWAGYERALSIRRDAFGPGHFLLAPSLSRLAVVATAQGRAEEGIPLARRSVEIMEAQLGADTMFTGRALNNLAHAQLAAGQLAEAEAATVRMIEIFERHIDASHPQLGLAHNNLAAILLEQGKREAATAEMRVALSMRERSLGREHPVVVGMLDELGEVLVAQGLAAEAVSLHERALAVHEAAREGHEPLAARSMIGLTTALVEDGQIERGVSTGRRAVALATALDDPALLMRGRFALARGLGRAPGGRAEAIGLARAALAAARAGEHGDDAAEIEAWLRER